MIYERPNGALIVFFGSIGIGLLYAGWRMLELQELLMALGALSLVMAVLLLGWYGLDVWINYRQALHDMATSSRVVREAEAVAKLSPEQAALITQNQFGAMIAVIADPKGQQLRRFYLYSVDGLIPWEFCQVFLSNSGVTHLEPVSRHHEGSQAYDYARWFTRWLRENGFAIGGEGSIAGKEAQWMTTDSKMLACKIFDVELIFKN